MQPPSDEILETFLNAEDQDAGYFVESSELARFLLESSRDCLMFLDAEQRLLYLNSSGQELLGIRRIDRYLKKTWLNLLGEGARELARSAIARADQGKAVEFQVHSPTFDGETKWWLISVKPLTGSFGKPHRFYVVWREMTEYMLAVKALRQSEEAFRKVFEENPIGIVISELDFRITKVNNALCGILGFTEGELIGRDLRELAVEDRVQVEGLMQVASQHASSVLRELKFLTKRGRTVWGHTTTSLIRDGERVPLYLVQMIENISERKKSEEQLIGYQEQLQSLASELALSEEKERRRIATDLHDRIGQTLAFARLRLGTISQGAGGLTGESIGAIRELIEQAIVDTRSLTFELSPPVLYELGLVPALEWLARKTQQDHGIETRFQDDGQPKPLDEKFRVVLFQAVRELLFNVVKHAQASHAQIIMRRDADALRIIIEDNGAGFDPHALEGDKMRGFGLFNVRERIEYLGGRMKVRSEPGAGSRITLMAPLQLTT
jgi:PAS domain S-box-containing protein